MDSLTAATVFATIVQLICNFRAERGARESVNHSDFIAWLEYHKHEEIKNLISNTYHLQAEIDQLLREDHSKILDAVSHGNQLLTDVLSRIEAFAPLASRIVPRKNLSDQAILILRQLRDSGAPEVAFRKYIGGCDLVAFHYGASGGQLELLDPVFVEDDLKTMAELGLLRLRISDRGDEFFGITRPAVDLLESLDLT